EVVGELLRPERRNRAQVRVPLRVTSPWVSSNPHDHAEGVLGLAVAQEAQEADSVLLLRRAVASAATFAQPLEHGGDGRELRVGRARDALGPWPCRQGGRAPPLGGVRGFFLLSRRRRRRRRRSKG